MRAIDRKLLRELVRLKGQIFTIALVLAGGMTSLIALRGSSASLDSACSAYYDDYRFAHVFARVNRAPEALLPRLEALPGVSRIQTRVAEEVTLPLPGMDRPAYGRLLSLPSVGEPLTNALRLVAGRQPAHGREDEVVLLKAFADAHQLRPEQSVPVVINGKLRRLRVVGVALSPEFVYAIRPGAIVDDPKRYAVLWMDRRALGAAFDMDGSFNDVSLRLQRGASESAVIAALDELLAPYGADGAFGRKDQISSKILSGELGQLSVLGGMIPLVFLGVAAFLVNLVLGRLIRLQRHEIATLKAVGYSDLEVGRHYLGLVLVVLLPGILLGLLGGWALGKFVMNAYAAVFRFPRLEFVLSPQLAALGALVSLIAAGGGALLAVRTAVRLPPAEAMRPPAPARYRRSWLESLGFATLFGPAMMMVLREVLRRPLKTLLSSFGIAGAVALLILGRFGWDSVTYYFESVFRREQRQDLSVAFAHPVAPGAIDELARWPGVLEAEGLRAVPIKAHFEQRSRSSVLLGLTQNSALRRLLSREGELVDVPQDGVMITKTLAEVLGISLGDRIGLDLLEGERKSVQARVTGFIDEASGLQVYASQSLVSSLVGDWGAISLAVLRVDDGAKPAIERRLRDSPQVIDVSDAADDMRRMREMNASFIDIWTMVSIALSASVIFGVNYNNARIALSARSRDLASLRVLGYSRREVSKVLLGGLAIEVGLAIPLGLYLGRVWAEQFMRMSLDPETFRWSTIIAPRTYLLATAVALAAAVVSALWVRRNLDNLDLVGVLKTRE